MQTCYSQRTREHAGSFNRTCKTSMSCIDSFQNMGAILVWTFRQVAIPVSPSQVLIGGLIGVPLQETKSIQQKRIIKIGCIMGWCYVSKLHCCTGVRISCISPAKPKQVFYYDFSIFNIFSCLLSSVFSLEFISIAKAMNIQS